MTKKIIKVINVFEYDDYRKFLAHFYEMKKQEMPNKFSYRYLSQKAGFQTSTFLHRVIIGKRNLTLESIRKIATIIPLEGRPYQYFETLVLFNQAKTDQEKAEHFEKIKTFKEYIALKIIHENQKTYLSKWFYPVVREMVKWPGFKAEASWVSIRVCPKILVKQAQEALDILLKLGLIKQNDDGTWSQDYPKIMTQAEGLGAEALNYHKSALQLSQQSLNLPAEERHVSAMTISMSPALFELVRRKIHIFHKEMSGLISEKITKDLLRKNGIDEELINAKGFFDITDVCQVNMQMFKVAKQGKDNEK